MVIEKPFGHDLKSARELNDIVESVFPADSVFRIDHYLGKETVQNLLALRFANQMFEPVWNANYVDHVQITMAEDIGIGGRAGYYDGIGAARDVIQNHLLQLLALTAMEEPVSFGAAGPAAEKEKVLSAVRLPADLATATARGQYAAGWQGGEEVGRLPRGGRRRPRTRRTETYAAVRLDIDTRRWAGCRSTCAPASGSASGSPRSPWSSRQAPHLPFEDTATEELGKNAIVIRVQPDEGVTLRFGAKVPGAQMEVRDVTMDFGYGRAFTESSPEAYERLILDVLLGEPPLFPRHEEVELSWQILDPIERYWAQQKGQPDQYRAGGWGPAQRRRDDARATDASGGCHDHPTRRPRPSGPRTADASADIAKLVRLRDDTGAMALSRVLTLVIVVDEPDAEEAIEAANQASRQHPCRIIVVVIRQQARAPPGSTPRSGSAATPARARSSSCGSTARSPRTAAASSPRCCWPTPPSWLVARRTVPAAPRQGPDRRDGPAPDHRRRGDVEPGATHRAPPTLPTATRGRHRPGLDAGHPVAAVCSRPPSTSRPTSR